jgi:hypothetical protein
MAGAAVQPVSALPVLRINRSFRRQDREGAKQPFLKIFEAFADVCAFALNAER